MKKKPTKLRTFDPTQPYVMRIADLLSDDPMLIGLLGHSFKVIADYDTAAKRVTYSFRRTDDTHPGESDATPV